MTEQQSEALTVRLTRIWQEQLVSSVQSVDGDPGAFTAEVQVGDYRVCLCHVNDQCIYLRPNSADWKEHHMSCYFDGLLIVKSEFEEGTMTYRKQQLEQVWLPVFRRGCWLSGCPIEATAHEKAEWIQGFSREELEAWNLTI